MTNQFVTKAVSFNITDPDQNALYEHAMQRKNFSSYIKRLIQRDIDNAFIPQLVQAQQEEEVKMDSGLMNNLI
jgi:hypothetical protein